MWLGRRSRQGYPSDLVTAPDPAIARTLARHPRPLGGDTARNLPEAAVSLTGMVLNNADESRQVMRIGRDRKSTRLNSSHVSESRMPSSA